MLLPVTKDEWGNVGLMDVKDIKITDKSSKVLKIITNSTFNSLRQLF